MSAVRISRTLVALAIVGLASQVTMRSAESRLWDDRPLKIIQTTQANFPPGLASRGITQGEVRAIVHVDASGRLLDCLVLAYTARELATELESALPEWKFEPAWQRGEPVGARSDVTFNFEAHGLVISVSGADAVLAGPPRLIPDEMIAVICRSSELDEPLQPKRAVSPRHPGKAVKAAPAQPIAVVDFYVDQRGRPRMPVVIRASHELYGMAAIEALLQWEFAPPKRGGTPAVVRATQVFAFAEGS